MAGQNRSNVTVTVDTYKLDAYSAHAGIAALPTEQAGMPSIGTVEANISFQIDLNDQTDPSTFTTIKGLFDLCNKAKKDNIKPIKLEFWKDQSHQDTHIVLKFDGWVSSWHISSGNGTNHVLAISVTPRLDPQHFLSIEVAN